MTDRNAILRKIIEEPANDDHRLAFAAWCQDDGDDPARAEFIRMQVELARAKHEPPCFGLRCSCHIAELHHRERELLTGQNAAKWCGQESKGKIQWGLEGLQVYAVGGIPPSLRIRTQWSRGFISSLTISWSDWLAHHAALYWHPEQRVECPKCKGSGRAPFANEWQCWTCGTEGKRGAASGTVPRPFVATAQPLELMRLTTLDGQEAVDSATRMFTMEGEEGPRDYRFDRVKCPTCDGRGYNRWTDMYVDGVRQYNDAPGNTVECPDCHGIPLNCWTCDKWPGLEFTMPEAAAHEVAPPAAGWTWRVDRSGLTTPINHFTVIGLLTVHLEWFHQWDGDAPTLGTQFRIDQPNITTEAFLASVEPELRGRERWLRLTAVGIGVPIFRGESVLR